MMGTLYVSSLLAETRIDKLISGKIKDFVKAYKLLPMKHGYIGVNSATNMKCTTTNSLDYIFTDPPFGANIMYSELNFLWESWLKVKTNNRSEAIMNKVQNKGLQEYQDLMKQAFQEYYRVLKPNRWITVVFHNSKSSVWNVIQDALIKSGFLIAQVSVLDKKQGSFKQVTSTGAVKNDLVISAYKPKGAFEQQFLSQAGEGLEEDFIQMHLEHLAVEPTVERTEQMLYSKLIAYYVQRGYTIKYNSRTFFSMLHDHFVEADGYWFHSEQLADYQEFKQKMKLEGLDNLGQVHLFVSDEKSALIWLHSFLDVPKDFQNIHPAFTKISSISGDLVPELSQLLEENFILEGGKYRRPMNAEEKDTQEEKRHKRLLHEFDVLLLEAKGSEKKTRKKIKACRKQALLAGFEHCYRSKRFADILILAKKLDSKILETSAEITEFIEIAEVKVEGF